MAQNTRKTGIQLSEDQQSAYDTIRDWIGSNNEESTLSCGGYAGTGKTTLLSVLAKDKEIGPVAFVAYTGKAASVLGRKLREHNVVTRNKTLNRGERDDYAPLAPMPITGRPRMEFRPIAYTQELDDAGYPTGAPPFCGTIHSLIYRPCDCINEGEIKLNELGEPIIDPATGKPAVVTVERPCKKCGERRFHRREDLDARYCLIIVDEASMVSDDMLDDLRGFGVPILAVGDHGQLPPVRGTGSLMRNPDIRLERIHRQAEGNPIIALSKAIRETGEFDRRLENGKQLLFKTLRDLPTLIRERYGEVEAAKLFDMALISYTNKRRCGLNQMVREARGISDDVPPQQGEQLICLRNMKPIFNGMRGVLLDDTVFNKRYPWQLTGIVDFPEDGIAAREIAMCAYQFARDKTFENADEIREVAGETSIYNMRTAGNLFDFGYALTCHKSQGSGWPDVIVLAETYGMPEEQAMRWKYTAVTRSSSRLTVLMPR